MAYKDPSGNWFEGLFDTWDYRDTGNPASDALANTTTAIVNTPASLLNAGLEGLRQIGELVAPHEPTITNFTVSTPVPHDDVLAAGVKVVAAASKLPTGKLGGNFVKIGEVAKEVTLSRKLHGEAAQHAADAIKAGKPNVLTIDRVGAPANRQASTGAFDKVPGKHLDEYPPAMFKEGGAGASVRPINPRDNMSAGACVGNACRGLPDGTRVRINVGD
ncbi:NucA/NucB deoxyribonuclease domain-containing protein [Pannonibacter phragmitetus]|uniref:Deoxyribonuclease NucA/NucB domain-containing protein n=1 Tax=Pannonibacter phragmitetus TaxID=121719 RepID=A0A0U3FPB0_9HYPH|nr:NucA/NucB deoxyribonuclease domain-containing protein [Pannonibacter phragmitetus]ALV28014.1 hypothetical protein APZ00_13835 [Pannonibacter phragmitetus]